MATFRIALVTLVLTLTNLWAEETPTAQTEPHRPTATDATILGVVEGVTEFLPVSSTGHLIITSEKLGLDNEEANLVSPKHPDKPFSIKDATDAYVVIIQVGAIAAVALLYWKQLLEMLQGVLGKNPAGFRLLRNIFLACVPPGLAGLLLDHWIEANLFSVKTVIWALIVGAGLMFFAEYFLKRKLAHMSKDDTGTELLPENLGVGGSIFIGFMQCLALWPGMSRSMVTMVGGYLTGLRPKQAAEFSFLVGLALLSAAAGYKGLKTGHEVIAVFGWGNLAIGIGVAAVAAAIAVKGFVGYLTKHGLGVFAIYRILLAIVLLVFWV